MAKATAKNVDFSNVREVSNFNSRRIPAGDYLAQVTKVEDGVSKKDDGFQYIFTIKVKKFSQSAFPYYCKLQENQLWKLRNLLIAAGLNVPKKRMKLDPNKVVGKTIGVTIEDDEYEGRERSEIAAVFPAAELTDGMDDDSDDDDAGEDDEPEAVDVDDEDITDEEAEDEPEEDEEEDEGEASPYADYDRTKLKREIKKIDKGYSVKKSQSDDDLRAVLAELSNKGSDNSDDDEDDLEELDLDSL